MAFGDDEAGDGEEEKPSEDEQKIFKWDKFLLIREAWQADVGDAELKKL